MGLSDHDKELAKKLIDEGKPLPQRLRAELFEDPREVELIWHGKTSEVTNVVLPFQSIEQVDEPRREAEAAGETMDLFSLDTATGRQQAGWSNKLIWGDNKLVLSSLKNGPLRREIEEAGGLKLVYIDPPFDVGADFSFDVAVGESEKLSKSPSIIEELAYRDTWGKRPDSYLTMLYERLLIMKGLLAENGVMWVHMGWQMCHFVKAVLDDVFGRDRLINQVIWKRQTAHSDIGQGSKHMGPIHDVILLYSRSGSFPWNMQYLPYSDEYKAAFYRHVEPGTNRRYRLSDITGPGGASKGNPHYEFLGVTRYWRFSEARMQELYEQGRIIQTRPGTVPAQKRYLDEMPGVPMQDLWVDVNAVQPQSSERLGYDTQKPEALLERVIELTSSEGDLVADFFCGSGTTMAVAEKLGRKWIGCDLGRFAIHTARKRLIGVQRQLQAEGEPYRAFEVLNLGKYERQYFVGINPNLPEEEKIKLSTQKEEQYLHLILQAYKGERVLQMPPFHGRVGKTMVVVGPLDAPVTQAIVHEAVDACKKQKISKVDILGFDFEMGLMPYEVDKAREKGVNLQLKYIPRDVFDKRAVAKGQVTFYDVAYVEVKPHIDGNKVRVELTDFGVYYRQDDDDEKIAKLKKGSSRVIVKAGQVVKVSKDKQGVVTEEVLTKQWSDWIDYWAVDFDFYTRAEFVRIVEDGHERQVCTGNYLFENEWQSFRTRKDRTLELVSGWNEYAKRGRTYSIAVKVIDIFGNDTTKVVEVKV